jgi:hypothetical protein
MSKAEVRIVARYYAIASTDKLIEALAFPTVSRPEYDVISTELDLRLSQFNRNQADLMTGR